MSASEVTIANMALSFLGHGRAIASLTERSAEAIAANEFYEQARDETLEARDWAWATKVAALSLVEELESDDVLADLGSFTYQYPADCAKMRRILSGSRVDNQSTGVPLRFVYATTGRYIVTDMEEAVAEYTKRVEDVGFWPKAFRRAVAYSLAGYIAPRLAMAPLMPQMRALYEAELSKAMALSAEEEWPEPPPATESIQARE